VQQNIERMMDSVIFVL